MGRFVVGDDRSQSGFYAASANTAPWPGFSADTLARRAANIAQAGGDIPGREFLAQPRLAPAAEGAVTMSQQTCPIQSQCVEYAM